MSPPRSLLSPGQTIPSTPHAAEKEHSGVALAFQTSSKLLHLFGLCPTSLETKTSSVLGRMPGWTREGRRWGGGGRRSWGRTQRPQGSPPCGAGNRWEPPGCVTVVPGSQEAPAQLPGVMATRSPAAGLPPGPRGCPSSQLTGCPGEAAEGNAAGLPEGPHGQETGPREPLRSPCPAHCSLCLLSTCRRRS